MYYRRYREDIFNVLLVMRGVKFTVFLLLGFLVNNARTKPALKGKIGPCAGAEDPMACLHGILMHGDSSIGDQHKAEDNYLKFKSALETAPKAKDGPQDPEQLYHGILMHGDSESGRVHEHDQVKPDHPTKKIGPEDAESMMHGVLMHGDNKPGHDHSKDHQQAKDNGQQQNVEPMDTNQLMHGLLMHGDAETPVQNHHVHETGASDDEQSKKKNGPLDLNEVMHGLMHDGKDVKHDVKSRGNSKSGKDKIGPDSQHLHGILMHGDDTTGHNHDKDHDENKGTPFRFNLEAIKNLGLDEDVLKSVGLDDAIKELNDYQEWTKERKEVEQGSTFATISDSILSDIQAMKMRYLARAQQASGDKPEKAKDFTADDAAANLKGQGHVHMDNDMKHDLELVGSTEPINSRHKVH